MKPDEPINGGRDNGESPEDIRARLLRDIESTRLPPEVREQILKEMPPHEEMERLYKEMQEKGGYSLEDLLDSATDEPIAQP